MSINLGLLIKLCLLTSFCRLRVTAEWLNLGSNSAVIAEYDCRSSKSPCSLTINGSKFRESVIQKKQRGIFPVQLRAGFFQFSTAASNEVRFTIIPKGRVYYSPDNLRDLIFPPQIPVVISELRFMVYQKTPIYLLSQFLPLSIVTNNTYQFTLFLNNKIVESGERRSGIWSFSHKLYLNTGNYHLSLVGKSTVDYWGNMPTMLDGYRGGRYMAIIKGVSDSSQDIVTTQPVVELAIKRTVPQPVNFKIRSRFKQYLLEKHASLR